MGINVFVDESLFVKSIGEIIETGGSFLRCVAFWSTLEVGRGTGRQFVIDSAVVPKLIVARKLTGQRNTDQQQK